ncbi:deleted in malignant brain tumors 1 protein-like [Ruditapes philippinarum]|uniref:deleted in malignant brain tumors 1 protein-like n=1 Tax=Ruditapes philippinarum TaxID=129788 RepID=UPI00295AAC6F|nr:deleted in malignant brain tumors 1 protein-like [Ruditapes philippinarum]
MGTFNGRTVGSVNIVKCPKGMKGEGRATCKQNLKWDKKIDKCVGFRFSNEEETENYVRPNLETNHDGEWKHVSSDNWNWKETQVACRDLLDLEFGGSIRLLWHTGSSQTKSIAVNIRCNGNEKTLGECIYKGTEDSQRSMMVLICFKSNISDGGSFKNITISSELPSTENPIPQKKNDLLWVKFLDTWSPVGKKCNNNGHEWNKKESKVACRSMFPDES